MCDIDLTSAYSLVHGQQPVFGHIHMPWTSYDGKDIKTIPFISCYNVRFIIGTVNTINFHMMVIIYLYLFPNVRFSTCTFLTTIVYMHEHVTMY